MRSRIACLIGFGLAVAGALGQTPSVLIIQNSSKEVSDESANVPLSNALAQQFDEDGRLQSVVWSLSDPTFREVVSRPGRTNYPVEPTVREALAFASRERWEYVFIVEGFRSGGDVFGSAVLYRAGREIWRDPGKPDSRQLKTYRQMLDKKAITKEQYDDQIRKLNYRAMQLIQAAGGEYDTVRSLARTWVQQLAVGTLRTLPGHARQATPEPNPGQGPPIDPPVLPTPTPTASPGPDNPAQPVDDFAAIRDKTHQLIDDGNALAAIALVRDAIDAKPLDMRRRQLLIDALIAAGMAAEAASEARHAAQLAPESVEGWLVSVRAWILLGKLAEAQADLNQAIARAPESVEVRLMQARLCLKQRQPAKALDHLAVALGKGPLAEAHYLRALTYAALGNSQLAAEDWMKALALGLADPDSPARYVEAVETIDDSVEGQGDELRSLLSRALVRRTDPEVRVILEKNVQASAGRLAFLQNLKLPDAHRKSHEQQVLALKLLAQTLSDVRRYLESGEEDTLADARINLGEALKGLAIARQALKNERTHTVSNAGNSPLDS